MAVTSSDRARSHPRRRLRQAEGGLSSLAFLLAVAASMGAVLAEKDLVYWFNWAHAEAKAPGAKVSLYAGFRAFCASSEVLGNSYKACATWEDMKTLGRHSSFGLTCDSAPPPPSPPPAPPPCADVTRNVTLPGTGAQVAECPFFLQCCPGGTGSGQHPTHSTLSLTCGNTMVRDCPVTCNVCAPTSTPRTFDYNDVLCANVNMHVLNAVLWCIGAGLMLIKRLMSCCIEPTKTRRKYKTAFDVLLSFLSTAFLAIVILLYAIKCYPGEAFEDLFLDWSSATSAQLALLDGIIKPSFGLGFFLGIAATVLQLGALCVSVVLACLTIKHGERTSDVFV